MQRCKQPRVTRKLQLVDGSARRPSERQAAPRFHRMVLLRRQMKEPKTEWGIAALRFTLQHSAAAAAAATAASPQSSLIFPQPFSQGRWKVGRRVQMPLKARLAVPRETQRENR